jgi:hypothetical protein
MSGWHAQNVTKKLPSHPAIQSDGSFLGRFSGTKNYRQKYRQKNSLAAANFQRPETIPRKINGLSKRAA